MARAAIATLTLLCAIVAVPSSAEAYKFLGTRFSQRTVVFHNTAGKYAKEVKAAARIWNRSGVRFRWKSGPRSRAAVTIKIDRHLPAAGLAATGPIIGGRHRTGTIFLRNDLRRNGSLGVTGIVAHEMGHLMGLEHENRRCAVMNAVLFMKCKRPGEQWQHRCRTLERDDVRGAVKLYGGRVKKVGREICAAEPQPPAPTEVRVGFLPNAVGATIAWRTPARAAKLRILRGEGSRCPTNAENFQGFVDEVDKPQPGVIQTATDYGSDTGGRCYAVFAIGKRGRPSAPATFFFVGAPLVDFTYEIWDPSDPLTIAFDSDAGDDGDIASLLWSFGDGTTSTERFPTHTYATAGPKTVTLTVTDDDGNRSTATKTIPVG
jgi:hypothetical protein